ncbi:unnamed protein product [Pleuronectes platessa]|uniref:Uncharacterized protein n=1 Tax=Pleuronectes platessa TaxID=8262 RepID=A0A9N7UUA3_PLEPL|nr:unnamed protein product [Pleuronectes platessa]
MEVLTHSQTLERNRTKSRDQTSSFLSSSPDNVSARVYFLRPSQNHNLQASLCNWTPSRCRSDTETRLRLDGSTSASQLRPKPPVLGRAVNVTGYNGRSSSDAALRGRRLRGAPEGGGSWSFTGAARSAPSQALRFLFAFSPWCQLSEQRCLLLTVGSCNSQL